MSNIITYPLGRNGNSVNLLAGPTPVYNRNASQNPLPPAAPSTLINTAATDPVPVLAPKLNPGDTYQLVYDVNQDGCLIDALGRCAGYAIVNGLTLSGGSLVNQVLVPKGQAVIDGVVTLPADTTVALSNGSNFLWLQRNGVIVIQLNTTAAPTAMPACYLGCAIQASGALTSIDLSGVCYARRGGLLYRQTGDAGTPDDQPPADLVVLTRTRGGLFLWDGVSHNAFLTAAQAQGALIGNWGQTPILNDKIEPPLTTWKAFAASVLVPVLYMQAGKMLRFVAGGTYKISSQSGLGQSFIGNRLSFAFLQMPFTGGALANVPSVDQWVPYPLSPSLTAWEARGDLIFDARGMAYPITAQFGSRIRFARAQNSQIDYAVSQNPYPFAGTGVDMRLGFGMKSELTEPDTATSFALTYLYAQVMN